METPDAQLASALLVALETDHDLETDKDGPALIAMAWEEVTERLANGAKVNGWYKGETLLSHAVGWRRLDAARLLLEHGARPNDVAVIGDPVLTRSSEVPFLEAPEMVRLFARYGANLTDFARDMMPFATGTEHMCPQPIKAEQIHLATARRGLYNPHPCTNPFYLNQIRTFNSAYWGMRRDFGDDVKHYGRGVSPFFSFDRFGRTATRLADGRLVLIAGEHEDSYSSDFCIYNDVCVVHEDGSAAFYLYPTDEFPPTDFHSATQIEDSIWIIGNLGYPKQRQYETTQVLKLDINTWRVTRIRTDGIMPGWISRHTAHRQGPDIIISGGKAGPVYRNNTTRYALNTRTLTWRQVP